MISSIFVEVKKKVKVKKVPLNRLPILLLVCQVVLPASLATKWPLCLVY